MQKSNEFIAGAIEKVTNEICARRGMELEEFLVKYFGSPFNLYWAQAWRLWNIEC